MSSELKLSHLSFQHPLQVDGRSLKGNNVTRKLVDLIKDAIANNYVLTIKEITALYLSVKFKEGKETALGYYQQDGRWFRGYLYQQQWVESVGMNKLEMYARQWFRNNLGAAILKGKLLVIPIIDIEETKK